MGNKIFIILIMFVFFLIMEIVMLGAFQLSHATGAKKIIGIMCRVFLVLFIIGYLGFVVLCIIVGCDFFSKGEIGQGISMFFFAALIAVCIYVWLIKGWIKRIKEIKNQCR